MSVITQRGPQEKEAAHEAKLLELIRSRIREARRSRVTGKLTVEIQLMKGGPSNVYTEVGITYRVLEES